VDEARAAYGKMKGLGTVVENGAGGFLFDGDGGAWLGDGGGRKREATEREVWKYFCQSHSFNSWGNIFVQQGI